MGFTHLQMPYFEHKHADTWWSHFYSFIDTKCGPDVNGDRGHGHLWTSSNIAWKKRGNPTKPRSDEIVRFKTGSLHTVRLDVSGYDILNANRSSSRFGRIHLSPSSDQTIWCDEGSSRTLLKVTTFVLQFKASHPRRNNPRASSEYNIQGVSRL